MYLDQNEIIIELYKTGFVRNYVTKLSKNRDYIDINDATQTIWLELLELPEGKLEEIFIRGGLNEIKKFTSGIIHKQIVSKTSKIYNEQFKKSACNLINEIYKNDSGRL